METMKLWDSLAETDPAHTRRIEQRGGFTAIDTHYQIMRLTETFGPAGMGWGWSVENVMYPPNDTVWVQIRFWHGNKENWFHVFGQKSLNINKKSGEKIADEDAMKKALSDALGKAASYIGCSADVYLGKFDDNKYVEGLIAKRERGTQASIDHYGGTPEKLKDWLLNRIWESATFGEYSDAWREVSAQRSLLKTLSPELHKGFEDECGSFSRGLSGHPMSEVK